MFPMREGSIEQVCQSAETRSICQSATYNLKETSYSSFWYVILCKINVLHCWKKFVISLTTEKCAPKKLFFNFLQKNKKKLITPVSIQFFFKLLMLVDVSSQFNVLFEIKDNVLLIPIN